MPLYGVDMGDQYHEAGDSASFVGSYNTACLFPRNSQEHRLLSSFSLDIQCAAFNTFEGKFRSERCGGDIAYAAVLVHHNDSLKQIVLESFA